MSSNLILSVNRLVHEPARLLILKYLANIEYCDFNFLLNLTELTKGNLSSHLRKLEDSNYIVVKKQIINRKQNTIFNISESGLDEYNKYCKFMKTFLE